MSSPILHHAVLRLEIGELIGQGDLGIFRPPFNCPCPQIHARLSFRTGMGERRYSRMDDQVTL